MLPLETLPHGDPSGGVVYLWNVLSPEEASCMWMFLNINVLQVGVVIPSPNPQAGGLPLVGCPRLLLQFIRSYPPYRRLFLYPQPEDAPCRSDRDPLHGIEITNKVIIVACSWLFILLYYSSHFTNTVRHHLKRWPVVYKWITAHFFS